jgi:hypothetical protein
VTSGPLELGSDIGGSVHQPAHFCGIYAHKPTFEIYPQLGHVPRKAAGGARRSRSSHCYNRFIISGLRDICGAPRPRYTSSALGAGFPTPRRRAGRCAALLTCEVHRLTGETVKLTR